jgi:hypothetical protein
MELHRGPALRSTLVLEQKRKLISRPHHCRLAHSMKTQITRDLLLPSQTGDLSMGMRRHRQLLRMATAGSTNHRKKEELQQHNHECQRHRDTRDKEEKGDHNRSTSLRLR